MATFSFRAECSVDVDRFLERCKAKDIQVSIVRKVDYPIPPDVAVEIKSAATLEALRKVVRRVPDGHVMLQTLRAASIAKNSMERDDSLE